MNTRAHWRLILGIVALVLSLGVVFTLATAKTGAGPIGGFPGFVTVPVQPVTVLVTTKSGGVVAEVYGKPGERIAKGSSLLRLEMAPLATQRSELASALRGARAALQSSRELLVLPASLRAAVVDAHPDVRAAEDRYVGTVAALERARASAGELPATQAAWVKAAAERIRVRERLSGALSNAGASAELAAMIPVLEGRIRDVDQMLRESEVRSPVDAEIDIFDLHAGDRLLPGSPAAVLLLPGEYFCEFPVPVSASAHLKVGMESQGTIGAKRDPIRWRIESLGLRTIPVGLRENREVAQEMLVRARFSAAGALRGAFAVLDVPVSRASR